MTMQSESERARKREAHSQTLLHFFLPLVHLAGLLKHGPISQPTQIQDHSPLHCCSKHCLQHSCVWTAKPTITNVLLYMETSKSVPPTAVNAHGLVEKTPHTSNKPLTVGHISRHFVFGHYNVLSNGGLLLGAVSSVRHGQDLLYSGLASTCCGATLAHAQRKSSRAHRIKPYQAGCMRKKLKLRKY